MLKAFCDDKRYLHKKCRLLLRSSVVNAAQVAMKSSAPFPRTIFPVLSDLEVRCQKTTIAK